MTEIQAALERLFRDRGATDPDVIATEVLGLFRARGWREAPVAAPRVESGPPVPPTPAFHEAREQLRGQT